MADSSILSKQIVRGLNDKLYEKRKIAALEVEKLIRENIKTPDRVRQILNTLVQDFAYSIHPNARNGGLIALAAASIALGNQELAGYLDDIIPPVLACFTDQDTRVRYYACESMYNIAKVARGEVLRYFNEIFDALSKLAADSELSVKNGAELVDRLIKDIVSEQATTYISYVTPLGEHITDHESTGEEQEPDEADPNLPDDLPASLPRNTAFQLPKFIPLLAERIYSLNPFTRSFLVSWITVLDSIPDLELVSFLPEFLDGLLKFLSDPNPDIRLATSAVLADFLREIREAAELTQRQARMDQEKELREREPGQDETTLSETASVNSASARESGDISGEKSELGEDGEGSEIKHLGEENDPWDAIGLPSESEGKGKGIWVPGQGVVVDYVRITQIFLPHLSSSDEEIQQTALRWINEFIILAKDVMVVFTPQLISAVLPCLAHPIHSIRTIAIETNNNLHKLIFDAPTSSATPSSQLQSQSQTSGGSEPSTSPPSHTSPVTSPTPAEQAVSATRVSDPQQQQYHDSSQPNDPFDYQATVNTLTLQFLNEHEETRVAALEWLLMLHKKLPKKILVSDDGTFPALLKTLSDPSEEVVKRDLQLLAQISSYSDTEYFTLFMMNLLSLFSTDRRLLETRGSLIIRQLCLSLNSERIYRTFAEILEKDEDLEFASIMVQNLNIILITSPELADLRKRLKNLETKDGQMLFTALYRSWCHNAVATFSLCLLAQAYEHAASLLQNFAELDITVNFLIQIDKLVQLLESPVFTYLRLQLLEPEKYPHLFKCLYGLLMLLPQSSAFATLRSRLNSVSSLGFLHLVPRSETMSKRPIKPKDDGIKFQELLAHFRAVQAKHEKSRRQVLQALGPAATSPPTRPARRSIRERSMQNTTASTAQKPRANLHTPTLPNGAGLGGMRSASPSSSGIRVQQNKRSLARKT
ncbi:uncharacterized protein VTP21DRAFT_6526 [Calcarisporiella thermophila]|uniref:uncharacterized protein n=1 Tax=Calcarisporiella thermophila TaxID=911321 RepID=UPI003743A9BF